MSFFYNILFWLIKKASSGFLFIERCLELILLWTSFFDVEWQDIKSGHFLRGESIQRKCILNDSFHVAVAKEAIVRMDFEYQERKKMSFEKVKILFQIMTLIFTIISGALVYIIKEFNNGISFIFLLALTFSIISFFMILTYYKVATFNGISFTDADCTEATEASFLSDKLWCIEMNNARLNYSVTIYKSAMRYFLVSVLFLVAALYVQFKCYL